MKAVLFALALTAGVFALGPSVASANVSSFNVNSHATLSPTKTSLTVTGSIVCSAGEVADVQVIVTQSSGQVDAAGTNSTGQVNCTGQVQWWSVAVDVLIGSAFKNGPAIALATACSGPAPTPEEPFPEQECYPLVNSGIKVQK